MRIVVDVMGGDHGPAPIIGGAKMALDLYPQIAELFLVGQESEIAAARKQVGLKDSRVTVVHASQVLTMEDKPVEGLRKKKDCSLLRAVDLVKEGKGQAIISTGNTGGLVAASTIRLRTLQGVEKAAIAPVMPSENSYWVLVDAGATPEAKAIYLAQFAIMGSLYCQKILGTERPRVGILSNGTEETKGTDLTREAARLCSELKDLNFIGYVEGHDLFADAVEVVVTDGFTGNIVLKTCESLGSAIGRLLKRELKADPIRQLGALLAKPALMKMKTRMDPDAYGGAPLLGLNGNVIKAHGKARETAICNAIRVATETISNQLNDSIIKSIAKATQVLNAMPKS